MEEHALRELIDAVEAGRLSRRRFVQTMIGVLAAAVLVQADVMRRQPTSEPITPLTPPTFAMRSEAAGLSPAAEASADMIQEDADGRA